MTAKNEAKNRDRKAARRRRRARAARRWLLLGTVAVLALGFLAIGARVLLDRHPELTVQTYPVEYADLIRLSAQENGLEPAYVAAVILAESSYRPEAVSSAGARGLMQIVPATGEWIAGKLGETFSEDALFDPATNIRYGCWYLGFLMDRYGGDMRCASAAYHQGQGTVDAWLKDPRLSADGKTLDRIDSDVTQRYVDRILKYYERYEEIYAA